MLISLQDRAATDVVGNKGDFDFDFDFNSSDCGLVTDLDLVSLWVWSSDVYRIDKFTLIWSFGKTMKEMVHTIINVQLF